MRITLSERKFTERIRELEGIGSDATADEITHRLDQYAKKLFQHLRAYGLNQIGLVSMNGTLGEFFVGLDACWDDASRNERIAGLAMLDPLSVTLEARDLPAFFVGLLLTSMEDSFDSYSTQFQRVTVGELDSGLQRVAEKIAFAPQQSPFEIQTESDAALLQEYNDEQFELFCARSGVKVPGAGRRAREAAEAAEAAEAERYQAARKKQIEDMFSNQE